MSMNPWLLQEVTSRMEDDRRKAAAYRLAGATAQRREWSRWLGGLLIRAGRRLAGPEKGPIGQPGLTMTHHGAGY